MTPQGAILHALTDVASLLTMADDLFGVACVLTSQHPQRRCTFIENIDQEHDPETRLDVPHSKGGGLTGAAGPSGARAHQKTSIFASSGGTVQRFPRCPSRMCKSQRGRGVCDRQSHFQMLFILPNNAKSHHGGESGTKVTAEALTRNICLSRCSRRKTEVERRRSCRKNSRGPNERTHSRGVCNRGEVLIVRIARLDLRRRCLAVLTLSTISGRSMAALLRNF